MATIDVLSQEESSPQDTPARSEIATIDVPSQEESSPQDSSPQDTPALSEIYISKEEPGFQPSYAIEKIDNKDNVGQVATWKLRLHSLLPFSSACAIAAYWLYIAFRVRYTVAAQNQRHTIYPVAWLFVSIELGVACEPPYIFRFISWISADADIS